MSPLPAGREADPEDGARGYQRHRPEQTLLCLLVSPYYPLFTDQMAARGRPLPAYIQREFEDYDLSANSEMGFVALTFRFARNAEVRSRCLRALKTRW